MMEVIFVNNGVEVARISEGPTIVINPNLTIPDAGYMAAWAFWDAFREKLEYLWENKDE